MIIEAKHLQLSTGGTEILRDVSVSVGPGEIYGMLGPNGAGKSTTVAVILGLYAANRGSLRLFGGPDGPPSMSAKHRMGVMPEYGGFYDWMDATTYLSWYVSLYDGPCYSIPRVLDEVGLADVGTRPIGLFSRGMRQRLGLARAMVHVPELLILDEPTNGLDPRGRREIHDLLRAWVQSRRAAVLICTHLLDDVMRLCDRVGIIHHGRTVLEGPLWEVLADHGAGQRFRIHVQESSDEIDLPPGVSLVGREQGWWSLSLSGIVPGDAWRQLLDKGVRIQEIHAEASGIEELYMRMTADAAATNTGEAS